MWRLWFCKHGLQLWFCKCGNCNFGFAIMVLKLWVWKCCTCCFVNVDMQLRFLQNARSAEQFVFTHLRNLPGRLGTPLGRSWSLLDRSLFALGRSGGALGRSWAALGLLLAAPGGAFFCPQRGFSIHFGVRGHTKKRQDTIVWKLRTLYGFACGLIRFSMCRALHQVNHHQAQTKTRLHTRAIHIVVCHHHPLSLSFSPCLFSDLVDSTCFLRSRSFTNRHITICCQWSVIAFGGCMSWSLVVSMWLFVSWAQSRRSHWV